MAEPVVYEPVELVLDSLLLNGAEASYVSSSAVTKSYVDVLVQSTKDSLLGGVGPAYDTLKELSDALTASGGTLSTEIINKIADEKKERVAGDNFLSAGITNEATNRMNADTALGSRITTEKNDRIDALTEAKTASDLYADDAVEVEKSRAQGVEEGYGSRITTTEGNVTSLQDDKFNKSGGNISGDVKLVDSYLQFGDNWRVRASADGSKIVFEFKKLDVWKPALPFICKA